MAETVWPKLFPNTSILAWQQLILTKAILLLYVQFDNIGCFLKFEWGIGLLDMVSNDNDAMY